MWEKNMNKKIFSVAILSILLLAVSVVAVNSDKRDIAPAEKTPSGAPEAGVAFHETYYTSATNLVTTNSTTGVTVLTQSVFAPAPAELVATFSAESNTGLSNTALVTVLVDGVAALPGTVFFDQASDEDGFQAHSFTFGRTFLAAGSHTVTVRLASSTSTQFVSVWFRSLTTQLEEFP